MRLYKRVNVFRRFTNRPFQRMFFKNLGIVLAGIMLPLMVTVLTLYYFSNRLLLNETDSANYRSLENTKSTLDVICLETEALLYQYLSSEDIRTLLSVKKDTHPNYNFIAAANRTLQLIHASQRSYLDDTLILYSDVNNYALSTRYGGQGFANTLEKDLIDTYRKLKDEQPTKNIFCVARSINSTEDNNPQVITFYRSIPTQQSSPYSFAAVNLDRYMLTNYLTNITSNHQATILIADAQGNILYNSVQTEAPLSPTDVAAVFNNPSHADSFFAEPQGAVTVSDDLSASRVSWIQAKNYGWKYIQIVPMDDYASGMRQLRNILVLVMIPSLLVSIGVACSVSNRMFRPLEDILHIVENPTNFDTSDSKNDEIQFLFMNILESFQRNITLEKEMVSRKTLLRNARAKALQEQIAPHFLYNALQSIHWLAVTETQLENSRTSQSIITLSELIRACMIDAGNLTVVSEELDYIQKFMEIERLRFGDEIICHYQIDPTVLSWKMVRLSLQPLVENAISHGIRPHNCKGNIYIKINRLYEGMLYVSVEDDGVGMSREEINIFNSRSSQEYVYASQHVGLVNLAQRIMLVYGEDCTLMLDQSAYGGLRVEMTLPQT